MRIVIAALIGLSLWSTIGSAHEDQATGSPRQRQIAQQRNVPIASRLLPGDELVLIEPEGYGTRFVNPSVPDLPDDLDLRARVSDLIVVAQLVESQGMLVNNNSWIRTKLIFRSLRVIKDSKHVVTDTAPLITVYHDGGDIRINSVLVRAGFYYVYEVNKRYLLFLRSFSKDNNALSGVQVAVNDQNKLTSMQISNGRNSSGTSHLYGLNLEVVIKELNRRLGSKTP
jgi:hypothetical protein